MPDFVIVRSDGRTAREVALDSDLQRALATVSAVPVRQVPGRLREPHIIVQTWLIDDHRHKAEAAEFQRSRRFHTIDGTKARRRRLIVFDALMKALEQRGFQVRAIRKQVIATSKALGSQPVSLTIHEWDKQTAIPLTDKERKRLTRYPNQRYRFKFAPSGNLILQIRGFKAPGIRQVWEEGPHLRLESVLPELLSAILKYAATMEQLRRERFLSKLPIGTAQRVRGRTLPEPKWKR